MDVPTWVTKERAGPSATKKKKLKLWPFIGSLKIPATISNATLSHSEPIGFFLPNVKTTGNMTLKISV